jgi:hypothetical protein
LVAGDAGADEIVGEGGKVEAEFGVHVAFGVGAMESGAEKGAELGEESHGVCRVIQRRTGTWKKRRRAAALQKGPPRKAVPTKTRGEDKSEETGEEKPAPFETKGAAPA